jgi:hypothetical protein
LIDPGKREQRNYRSFRPNLNHGDDADPVAAALDGKQFSG